MIACVPYTTFGKTEVENEENGNDNKRILPEVTPGDADLPVSFLPSLSHLF